MPKPPSMPAPAAPAAAAPPPPTAVDPAVIAARQNLINRQAMAGRGSTVVPQTGSNGQTLGQAVAVGGYSMNAAPAPKATVMGDNSQSVLGL